MIIQIDENVILTGSVAKDAEVKTFNKAEKTLTIYNCSVAVDKIRQDNGEMKTVWANCYSWSPAVGKLKKGDKIFAVGKHEIQTYMNREGVTVSAEKINIEFIMTQGKSNYSASGTTNQVSQTQMQSFEEVDPDGELPF